MTTQDETRLEGIRARAETATPGPWSVSWLRGALRHITRNVDPDCFWAPDEGEDVDTAQMPSREDAAFIAAARDDVPWLVANLAESERARTEAEAKALNAAELALESELSALNESERAERAESALAEERAKREKAEQWCAHLERLAQSHDAGGWRERAETARLERQNADEQRALAVRMLDEERAKRETDNAVLNAAANMAHESEFAAIARAETAEARLADCGARLAVHERFTYCSLAHCTARPTHFAPGRRIGSCEEHAQVDEVRIAESSPRV